MCFGRLSDTMLSTTEPIGASTAYTFDIDVPTPGNVCEVEWSPTCVVSLAKSRQYQDQMMAVVLPIIATMKWPNLSTGVCIQQRSLLAVESSHSTQ